MSFKSSGPKTRPDRVKPPSSPPPPNPTSPLPNPSSQHHHNNHKRTPSTTSSTSTHSSTPSLPFHDAHFPPSVEASMLATSNTLKATANTLFAAADYSSAISTYDKALAELPSYMDYEAAVLQSNIAAGYVKLGEWKEVVECAERGLEGLERVLPSREGEERRRKRVRGERGREKRKTEKEKEGESGEGKNDGGARRRKKGLESDSDTDDDDDEPSHIQQTKANDTKNKPPTADDGQVVELPSDASESELEQKLHELNISDSLKRDVTRIRTKLLLRRARAKASLQPPTWSSLGGALEDYQLLSSNKEYFDTLPPNDKKTVRMALVTLPGRVSEAKDREMGEMMGKLKELGNGLLKPFGLSTDMFKMTQGSDGGWSLNVDQGGGRTGA